MFKNYLIIAIRNLRRNRLYSAINIFGLSLGIACCLLLASIVVIGLNTNKAIPNAEQIYQARTIHVTNDSTLISLGLSEAVLEQAQANINELTTGTAIHSLYSQIVTQHDRNNQSLHLADANFVKLFLPKLITGDVGNTFTIPGKAIISQSLALELYGSQNPIGEVLNVNNKSLLTINGVFQDYPESTFLNHYHILSARSSLAELKNSSRKAVIKFYTTITSKEQANFLGQQIEQYIQEDPDQKSTTQITFDPIVKSISDAFFPKSDDEKMAAYILLFAAGLCFIVLAVSCINFVNLTTARHSQRSLEVGIRKTAGAERNQLMIQFFTETLIMTSTALAVAVPLLVMLQTWAKHLGADIDVSALFSVELLIAITVIITFTTFMAGFYPALILSRVSPIKALKQKNDPTGKGRMRKALVISQFSISTLLLAFCLILHFQVNLLQQQNWGVDDENNLNLSSYPAEEWSQQRDILAHELQSIPEITSFSTDLNPKTLPLECSCNGIKLPKEIQVLSLDNNYQSHYGIKLLTGRHFVTDRPDDLGQLNIANKHYRDSSVMLTRQGLETLLLSSPENALNAVITCDNGQITLPVIGVADAFPLLTKIGSIPAPDLFFFNPQGSSSLNIKSQGIKKNDLENQIQSIWKDIYPDSTLYIRSDHETRKSIFETLFKTLWSVGSFGIMAVLIALMGLYAMSVFTVERRTKEIGIRKSLGASAKSITYSLIKDTCKPVVIALLISSPLTYLAGKLTLRLFYQEPPILLISFVLVPCSLLLLAAGTVTWHSLSAARTDPIKALRYE